jgi:hypothetical protein
MPLAECTILVETKAADLKADLLKVASWDAFVCLYIYDQLRQAKKNGVKIISRATLVMEFTIQ